MKRGDFLKRLGLGLYRLPQGAAGKIMVKYTGITEDMTEAQIDELGSPADIAESESEAYLKEHPHAEKRGVKLSTLGCLIPAAVTLGTVLFSLMLLFLVIDPLSKRIHIGNRVKGEIIIAVDGIPTEIKELKIEGKGSSRGRRIKYEGSAEYTFLGNEYEAYELVCILEDELPSVVISYYHFNWWEESDTKTFIDIHSGGEQTTFNYSINYKYLGEDNRWHTQEYDGEGEAAAGYIAVRYGG